MSVSAGIKDKKPIKNLIAGQINRFVKSHYDEHENMLYPQVSCCYSWLKSFTF